MQNAAATRVSHATAATLVSVYAAMLGFFAALNALSEPHDAQAQQMARAVQHSFGGKAAVPADGPVLIDPDIAATKPDTATDDTQAAFDLLAQALGVPAPLPHGDGALDVRLGFGALFAAGQSRMRADRLVALDQALAGLDGAAGWRLELRIAAAADSLARARVAGLADHMLARGVTAEGLAVIATPALVSADRLVIRLTRMPAGGA
ncbi:MAG: hypothetical protein Tsb0016_03980 [Sphingomonadales bacterium]